MLLLSSQAIQELMALKVVQVVQGVMALMDKKVNKESLAHLDPVGQWELKAHRATLGYKDSMDRQDLRVQMVAVGNLDVKEDEVKG